MQSLKLILVSLFLSLQVVGVSYECPPQAPVHVSVSQATAVFSGEVISEEYRDIKTDSSGKPTDVKALLVRLKVKRWWKGNEAEHVDRYTSVRKYSDGTTSVMAEDFQFRKGESYLVYAYGQEAKLWTTGCTRTRKLTSAGEDLGELGEGKAPKNKDVP